MLPLLFSLLLPFSSLAIIDLTVVTVVRNPSLMEFASERLYSTSSLFDLRVEVILASNSHSGGEL